MLRLILLRHAKAVPETALGDHGRALGRRGLAQAAMVGNYLRAQSLLPDVIVLSDAKRTVETCEGLGIVKSTSAGVRAEAGLYLASPRQILAAIHRCAATDKTVLMIGHNPGLAELADNLCGYGDRYALVRMREKFPPGGLAVLDFDGSDWSGVVDGCCRLDRFICPADLDGGLDE